MQVEPKPIEPKAVVPKTTDPTPTEPKSVEPTVKKSIVEAKENKEEKESQQAVCFALCPLSRGLDVPRFEGGCVW